MCVCKSEKEGVEMMVEIGHVSLNKLCTEVCGLRQL